MKELKEFAKEFERIWLGMFLTFFGAVINGTVFWALYPRIHELFPIAATNNIIADKLKWWSAVCICWMCGLLFKSDPKPMKMGKKIEPDNTEPNVNQ